MIDGGRAPASTLAAWVEASLAAQADPVRAAAMAAYMKTDMAFYGVPAPARRLIGREAARRFPPADAAAYAEGVLALWTLPAREPRYLAIQYALAFKGHITPAAIPLYRHLIVEGAWWDLVDEIACHLFGHLLARHPAATWPVLDAWIDDPDRWLRRTALLAQNRLKAGHDTARLLAWCRKCMHEKDFFIRKAIGWALRVHAKHAPVAVADFLAAERAHLAGLSYREAARGLTQGG